MILGARFTNLGDLDQTLLAYVEREVVIAWMRYRSQATDQESGTAQSYLLQMLTRGGRC
jgi:hypothetical protein